MGPYSGPTGESFKKVKWSQKVLVSGELMVAHLLYCSVLPMFLLENSVLLLIP